MATVRNEHVRTLPAPIARCAALVDDLASDRDRMWPSDHWPALRLAPDLRLGAPGGHGPIRYYVEELEPGRRVRFRFTAPSGFDGYHEFRLEESGPLHTTFTHVLSISPHHVARLSWPLAFRPLHDALIEDTLDRAESIVSGTESPAPRWSRSVRMLRSLARPRTRTTRSRPERRPRVEGGITGSAVAAERMSICPAYLDRFALTTDVVASPRAWALAMFEKAISRSDRDLVFQTLLGLRTAADGQPDSVAGWSIGSEDHHHVLLTASGRGTSANLLIEVHRGGVQLATALAFTSSLRAATWRLLLSPVHRREAAPTLRDAALHLQAVARSGDARAWPGNAT
ncbi:hypothetical protein [Isoptericola rhizosphaerae]|uniref:hypothetical protein n=1 Tax=Isoptericola rhizosphaerae TaxID=3377837 RepID=UPI00383AB18C